MITSPNPQHTPLTLTTIRSRHGQWACQNFSVHVPHLGIIEEVGELTHVLIKGMQKIHGINEQTFVPKVMDAICDALLFTLHLQFLAGITRECLDLNLFFHPSLGDELGELTILAGQVSQEVGQLVRRLDLYETGLHGSDFTNRQLRDLEWLTFALIGRLIVLSTRLTKCEDILPWITTICLDEVWVRDFRRYPENGLKPLFAMLLP
jgi:hypothetical protein